MSKGRIRAIGDSAGLKIKYGAGYKLSVISAPHKLRRTKDIISKLIPGAKLEDDSAGALLYQFPNSSLPYVSTLVKTLNTDPYVKGWGLSQTTLEQVFLSVIRHPDESDDKLKVIQMGQDKSLTDSSSTLGKTNIVDKNKD
jgi:hypothetical protein